MAILKCKMCGGELQLVNGDNICECEYCGSKQTVPTLDNEKKAKLYERAYKLRFNCEFDKAASVYENIINDFPDDAEGYWGLVLCNYGIEYVDDPATGIKVPTCHRSSFDSLLEDTDFEMVMENSDDDVRTLYRQEARQIEELRRQINEVSGKEEPYDIFICYKETDANGERTLDSVLAQDVYEALTEKGYRVFFSRITLEDKLGTEYEPYIFAALNSAKLMLAFGTSYENYNAVWVKNEWGRFVKLIAKDKTKHLIPCYKDIDPSFDLPTEFAKFQAQDMGKVGAMQDLLRGIDKLIGNNGDVGINQVAQGQADLGISALNAQTMALLNRGFMAIEDSEWENANDFFEEALNRNPMSVEAYLGKLMADVHVSKKENLRNINMPFDDNKNYQKLLRFCDESLKTELESDINFIKERNENEKNIAIYNEAINFMNSKKYVEAIEKFSSIIGYLDAEEKKSECKKLNEEVKRKIMECIHSGEVFDFGMYNEKPVKWKVIASKGEKKLIITENVIDMIPYNNTLQNITWETCTLRKYLNDTMYNNMFNITEQKIIFSVRNSNPSNSNYKTNGGNDTIDKLFLLSIEEVNNYLMIKEPKKNIKDMFLLKNKENIKDMFINKQNNDNDFSEKIYWWMRSPGYYKNFAAIAENDGNILAFGDCVNKNNIYIRPACWIDLSKI